jgi:hypothetical protein
MKNAEMRSENTEAKAPTPYQLVRISSIDKTVESLGHFRTFREALAARDAQSCWDYRVYRYRKLVFPVGT